MAEPVHYPRMIKHLFKKPLTISSRLVATGRLFCLGLVVASPLAARAWAQPPSSATGDSMQSTLEAVREASGSSMVAIARVEKDRAPRSAFAALAGTSSLGSQVISQFVGAGIICSSDGNVLTCAHVLGDPRQYDYFVCLDRRSFGKQVAIDPNNPSELNDSRMVPAQVMASDAFSDLAVLKTELSGLTQIEYGDVEGVKRGDAVVVLSSPDAIFQDGVAHAAGGVIRGLKRRAPEEDRGLTLSQPSTMHGYGTLVQVEVLAAVQAGTSHAEDDLFCTSGGAVVDLQGRLLAITTALVGEPGAEKAAGYAIPADATFQRMIDRMKTGRLPEFGFLGVQPSDLMAFDKELGHEGVLVQTVIEGLPGYRAGIRQQDIITQVNASSISNRDDLFRELSRAGANEDVILFVEKRGRPGEGRPVRVKLGKRPADADSRSYASAAPQPWRGMTVDYISALPGELLGGRLRGARARAKIAVTRVEPSSDAWRAGVRPGDAILSVLDSPMTTPEGFYSFTLSMLGQVEIEIVDSEGRKRLVEVRRQM